MTNGSVVADYTFDQITNPILMKTSVSTGRVDWAKQFLNNSESNGEINLIKDCVYFWTLFDILFKKI